MSDTDNTSSASEGNQPASGDAAAGQSGDGAGGGTLSSDEFEKRLEESKRASQSRIDKLEAKIKELETQAPKPAGEDDPKQEPTPGLTLEQLRAEMRRQREVDAAAAALKTEFPNADPSIFVETDRFESAESLRAAAEASHQRVQALIEPAVKEREAQLQARYAKAYGDLPPVDTGQGDGGTGAAGDPTYEQLLAMPLDEFEALDDEVVERVCAAKGVAA